MRFARAVFYVAGAWGVVVLTPFFFLFDAIGRQHGSPMTHPQFFYGFLSVAMAWQFGFFAIGSDPVRFRMMMIPSVIEKFGYVLTLAVLYAQQRISATDVLPAIPDFFLGILFAFAFVRTGRLTSDRR